MNYCISFTEPYGRLGNFLFQYSICKALSLEYNLNLIIPEISQLHLYFKNILYSKIPKNYTIIYENEFNYNIDLHSKIQKNINTNILLSGFWQTSKYFNKYSDIIRQNLQFINTHNVKSQMQKYYNISKNVVSIHIRRSDYLQFTGFITPSYTVIINSIIYLKKILENPVFLIFSDDYIWCKKYLNNIKNLYFSDFKSDDLCAMSLCTHNIISCSSYGWWGAYLNTNPDKIVISLDRNWFNPYDKILGIKNTIDVLEPNWISGIPSLEKIKLICDLSNYKNRVDYILNINCDKIVINLDSKYLQLYNNLEIQNTINNIKFDSNIWYIYIKFDSNFNYNFLQTIYRFPNTNILYDLNDSEVNIFTYKNLIYSDFIIGKNDTIIQYIKNKNSNFIKLDSYPKISESNFINYIFKYCT